MFSPHLQVKVLGEKKRKGLKGKRNAIMNICLVFA